MKKSDVQIGQNYLAKIAGKLTVVQIRDTRQLSGGWTAINQTTGRFVRIRSAQKLRKRL